MATIYEDGPHGPIEPVKDALKRMLDDAEKPNPSTGVVIGKDEAEVQERLDRLAVLGRYRVSDDDLIARYEMRKERFLRTAKMGVPKVILSGGGNLLKECIDDMVERFSGRLEKRLER